MKTHYTNKNHLCIGVDIVDNFLTDVVMGGEVLEDLRRVAHLLRLHLELAIIENLVQLLTKKLVDKSETQLKGD